MYETRSMFFPLGTFRVNFPSMSVAVPTWLPMTWTVAPVMGKPSASSTTVPVTVV